MKKALVFVLVALLAVGMIFAGNAKGASKKDALSLGINVGTNNGVVVNYGFGKFDLESIVGFGVLNGTGLDIEVAGNFEVVDVAKECRFDGAMPFTVGGEVFVQTDFKEVGLGVVAPLKLAYTFEDAPVTLYFRVAPGVYITFGENADVGFGVSAGLGATYNF